MDNIIDSQVQQGPISQKLIRNTLYNTVGVGWISLVSVYPIMAGLFGEDLVSAAFSREGKVKTRQPEVHKPVIDIEHREATVLHHGFGYGHGSDHKAA